MRIPGRSLQQIAERVILVRPTGFAYDEQTAASNGFQRTLAGNDVRAMAKLEFQALLDALRARGIGTTVMGPRDPAAPNAVFPNNWFSTHEDGRILLYPMATHSRRTERDGALDEALERQGFAVSELLDLSGWEEDDLALEGTGSMVLDRRARMAYASLSPRTSEAALDAWCWKMNFRSIGFNATMDGTVEGQPVYHTNVLMSIGDQFALICMDAIPYPGERREIAEELERSGKEIITISVEQMHAFAGNILQLRGAIGVFIILSATAYKALRPDQRTQLGQHGELVPVAIPTIEAVGGGSVRCMLAENFLPLRT